jgi:hypothetical protein
MQYNNSTDMYEAWEDGKHIEVDSDVLAETRQDMEKDGMSYEDAMNELLETSTWTGSTPMHGVYVDGKAQS